MRILASGNVGIGTATPSQKLEVNGNAIVKNTFVVEDSGSGIHLYTGLDNGDTGLSYTSRKTFHSRGMEISAIGSDNSGHSIRKDMDF